MVAVARRTKCGPSAIKTGYDAYTQEECRSDTVTISVPKGCVILLEAFNIGEAKYSVRRNDGRCLKHEKAVSTAEDVFTQMDAGNNAVMLPLTGDYELKLINNDASTKNIIFKKRELTPSQASFVLDRGMAVYVS